MSDSEHPGIKNENCKQPSVLMWRLITLLFILFCTTFPCFQAEAALPPDYTVKKVKLSLPFPEDDQLNYFIPQLLAGWNKNFSIPLEIDYNPGLGGAYAWSSISGAKADGYSAALLSMPSFQLQSVPKTRRYTLEEIDPVCNLAYVPCALWVHESSHIKTLDDFVFFAKTREFPVSIAGNGSYTEQHMATLILARQAGIALQYLPFMGTKGAAGAAKDGTAVACWGYALSPETFPGMRPLAVANEIRLPALPDVPTFPEKELDVRMGIYLGIGIPHLEDDYIREVIGEAFLETLYATPETALAEEKGFIMDPLFFPQMKEFLDGINNYLEGFHDDYQLFSR